MQQEYRPTHAALISDTWRGLWYAKYITPQKQAKVPVLNGEHVWNKNAGVRLDHVKHMSTEPCKITAQTLCEHWVRTGGDGVEGRFFTHNARKQ
jgi:hypothetical protein